MLAIQTYGGIQTYGVFKHIGCPNIQGISKHMQGVSKHIGGIQTYGRCPNMQEGIQTYGGCPNIQGASKHTCGCPNIWKHPNIQGPSREAGFATSSMYKPQSILGHTTGGFTTLTLAAHFVISIIFGASMGSRGNTAYLL